MDHPRHRTEHPDTFPRSSQHDPLRIVGANLRKDAGSEKATDDAHSPRTFFELQFSTRWWLRFFDATTPDRASALLCSDHIAPCVFPTLTISVYTDIQAWVEEHGYPSRCLSPPTLTLPRFAEEGIKPLRG